jgi:phosphocarrier protein
MLTTETEIINKLGLHARASAKLTQLAGKQVRGLDEQGHAPHQRQKHHGRDDARCRQGIKVTLETEGSTKRRPWKRCWH